MIRMFNFKDLYMDVEEARGLTIKTLKERYKEEIKEICNLIYSCAEDGKTIAGREFENKPEAKSIAFYFRQKGFITAVQLKEDIRGNRSYRLLIDWT
jgi:hypothetical protein